MLDIKFIRENPDKVKEGVKNKNFDPQLVDDWLKIDKEYSALLKELDLLREKRNNLADKVRNSKKPPTEKDLSEGKKIKTEIDRVGEKINKRSKWKDLLCQIPNLPADDVSIGKDESENIEIRRWGEIPKFDFKVKDYLDIGEALDIIDVKRAGKVSGTRFGYLKGDAVLLEIGLINLALEILTKEGFIPVIPPVMLKRDVEIGLGYGLDDAYILEKDDLVLVATAEHSLVAMHKDEVLDFKKLPTRYVGFSACFRREAGSYGKDTKGILRVHQFNKVEMVSFCDPEKDDEEHNYLVSLEEKLMQMLKIPYRVMKMCTGDLGGPTARKYDIEAWFPAENKYRETHSCSTCTDYQSRSLNIKTGKDGKLEYLHVLNGTVFSERPILAILENYQQKDGSVIVPEVLKKWVGKNKITR